MQRLMLIAVVCVLAISCAATYQGPVTQAVFESKNHTIPIEKLIKASKQILLMDGYQITYAEGGMISTAPKDIKLTSMYADCGTTMGIDYLKDNRTDTDVSINVLIESSTITVKSTIQGEYKPDAVDQNITLQCVSKGLIEDRLMNKILSTAKNL